jgi:hypothetical protein
MKTRFLILVLITTNSFADDLNKPRTLSSGSNAKIAKAIAQSYGNNQQSKMYQPKGATCSPQVGVVNVGRNSTVPKEVTTVVKGDVISVCR